MKLLFVFGTRPEAIKMAPLIREVRKHADRIEARVCVTAQHREMLDQVLALFGITPDHDLSVMEDNQTPTQVAAAVLERLEPILEAERPDWVLVQGDTTSAAAAAMAAFYARAKIAHVEAGLRTRDRWQPFPEEINRRIVSAIAELHLAPTTQSRENLLREGIDEHRILVAGNTVIDALRWVAAQRGKDVDAFVVPPGADLVLMTAHRRENFGEPLENICRAVAEVARGRNGRVHFLYPVHPNPSVREPVYRLLGNVPGVTLTAPLDYETLVRALKRARLVLTDSGGLQEEAPGLGVPVLVLREVTERPEAVEAGTARIVGTDPGRIVREVVRLLDDEAEHRKMARAVNPFGDGHASERIVRALLGERVEPFRRRQARDRLAEAAPHRRFVLVERAGYRRRRFMPIRLRLLWVTPNLPLRGVTAARERWWNLLARLAMRHDVELLAFVDPEDVAVEEDLPPGLAGLHRVVKGPWVPDDPLALVPRGVRGGFSHPALRVAVAERLAAGHFDLVQYEYTEMANVIVPSPVPRVLTVHQLGFAQEGPRWRAEGGGARRGVLALFRYFRDLDWELRAVRSAHHVITMSSEDATRLRRFLPELAVSVSPVGVDCGYFRPLQPGPSGATDLLFVGNFVHPPNVDAVRFLAREVLPRLGRAARTRIVGHNVPPEIAALAREGALEITGPVPDLRPHLAGAAVVVAPVRFGTGMRGKVLEALAMARPVVTTSVGAEGLGATSGQHLLVADGAAEFAAAVRQVLEVPGLAARLGAAGRALVEARFDWDAIATGHEDIYAEVLRDPRPAPPLPRERAAWLRATVGRLGWAPAVATGAALVALSGLRWHLAPRGGRRAIPAGADASAVGRRAAA